MVKLQMPTMLLDPGARRPGGLFRPSPARCSCIVPALPYETPLGVADHAAWRLHQRAVASAGEAVSPGPDEGLALHAREQAQAIRLLVPWRHCEWGAALNNGYCCAYGDDAVLSQFCGLRAVDRCGWLEQLTWLAQDGDPAATLDAGRDAWQHEPAWQGLRRLMENLLVTQDWFELHVAQNLVFDGVLYPLVYGDQSGGGIPGSGRLAGLMALVRAWHEDTGVRVDAGVAAAAQASPANAAHLQRWVGLWSEEVLRGFEPWADMAFGAGAPARQALAGARAGLERRIDRLMTRPGGPG